MTEFSPSEDFNVLDGPSEEDRRLDAALTRALEGEVFQDSPQGLVDRVFDASVADLPTRVLPFEATPAHRLRLPLVGYAALILAAVLTWIFVMDGGTPVEPERRLADASFADVTLEAPRRSEVMLAAVTDPDVDEEWFMEEGYGSGVQTEVEVVLRSRMFEVDDLAGDVLAMLGGPTS